jgi:hypothetical protein
MKNLKPYNSDCFEVHKKAVDNKNSGELKDRLQLINPKIETEYKNFLEKFENKKLDLLLPNSLLSLSKEDLLTLYNSQSSVIISLKANIQKLQIKTIVNTCQNCTIDSANTLDHILPKSKFPEFVVNPKNLFPCCSTCNSYKVDSIKASQGQLFLNLYLDDLPEEQYLFVDIFLDEFQEINFRFSLKNIDNKIDRELFSIIESHYNKLHLFERMRLKSIEYISELENNILTFRKSLPINNIIEHLIESINIDKKAYGYNHWKCILEITLLNSPIFIDRFK